MKFLNTFGYSIRKGLSNIARNKMFSIASIGTMAACIFMFCVFYALVVNVHYTVRNVESGVTITVFFEDDISQDKVDAIGQAIAGRDEVSKFDYISAEDAWESYKLEYFDGDEEAAASFGSDNPLANSASYEVFVKDVEQQTDLASYIEGLDGVESVEQSKAVANTLSDLNTLISVVSLVIIVILILVAIFLISNTVRAGIAIRKNEIGIMKLIGATDYFVRAPFVIEGVIIGLIGSAIPLVIVYFGYDRVIEIVRERFSFLDNLLNFVGVNNLFIVLLPVGLILGIGIGYIGSRLTIHRHINV